MTQGDSPVQAIPSPNIWRHPATYEIENRGVDPEGVIWAAMREVHDWAGADVLDIGCGSGFHLPLFARTARSVVGVEPHPPLLEAARERVTTADLGSTVDVRSGGAESLPVQDDSIDVSL